jgi:hypothetical protein
MRLGRPGAPYRKTGDGSSDIPFPRPSGTEITEARIAAESTVFHQVVKNRRHAHCKTQNLV